MPEFVPNQYNHLQADHFSPEHFHRPDTVDQPLYVICPIFNPIRFRSRWKLYKDFEEQVLRFKEAVLVTIECSFGDRAPALGQMPGRHIYIHVRSSHEAWIKENLINRAIQSLPADWQYVAWVDPDISFARPDWVGETIQQLQHYKFVQMFSQANDLGPNYESIKSYTSFGYCFLNPGKVPAFDRKGYYTVTSKGKGYWHPGFAWAARREAINHVGGLIDWGILGGGDTFMAYCIAGMLEKRIMPNSLGLNGVRWLQEWQNRCNQYILQDLGYVEGLINHHWHGSRKNRAYWDRGQILTDAKFNPETDIKKDWQGIWQLNTNNIALRNGIRSYLRARNEDGIDL